MAVPNIILQGDGSETKKWIIWAKKKLQLHKSLSGSGIVNQVMRPVSNVSVHIMSVNGLDTIKISGKGGVTACGLTCSADFTANVDLGGFWDGRAVEDNTVSFTFVPSANRCNHYMLADFGDTRPEFQIYAHNKEFVYTYRDPGTYTVTMKQVNQEPTIGQGSYYDNSSSSWITWEEIQPPHKEDITNPVITNVRSYERHGYGVDNDAAWIDYTANSWGVYHALDPSELTPETFIHAEHILTGGATTYAYSSIKTTMDIDLTGYDTDSTDIFLLVAKFTENTPASVVGVGSPNSWQANQEGVIEASIGGSLDREVYDALVVDRNYEGFHILKTLTAGTYYTDVVIQDAGGHAKKTEVGGCQIRNQFANGTYYGRPQSGDFEYPYLGGAWGVTPNDMSHGGQVWGMLVFRDGLTYKCERSREITVGA